jgi:excisionase family DNA binding protein
MAEADALRSSVRTASTVEVFTVDEAADQLRISRSRLYKLIAQGRVPSYRRLPGRSIRFTADDLQALLDAWRVDTDQSVIPLRRRGRR